ncbi:MAG: hypothetical protein IKG98_09700 [Ruminococcus sp.]|nr:hypothetical protein [Ruminococcus sp.]
MKKLLCGIIPLVLVLVLCTGCGSMERVDYQAVLLDYLSNRYPDDTFTVSSNQLDTGENTPELFFLHFRSEKYPDEGIIAWAEKVDGEYTFDDNYMKYYLRDDIAARGHDIAEKCFGECKVAVGYSNYRRCLPESFPTDATVEDFLQAEDSLKNKEDYHFIVYVPLGQLQSWEAKIKVREELKDFDYALENSIFKDSWFAVYIPPDNETYEKLTTIDSTSTFRERSNYTWVGSSSSVHIND